MCTVGCLQPKEEQEIPKSFDKGMEELILQNKKVGIEYYVKINMSKEILEYKMTYLGNIDNKTKGRLDLLYSTIYTGLYEDSKKANSIIAIYQDKKRLGQYYVGGGFNKIPIIFRNEIIISYNDDNCNQTTRISFKDSIPNKIYINCKENNGKMFGDLYNFEEN